MAAVMIGVDWRAGGLGHLLAQQLIAAGDPALGWPQFPMSMSAPSGLGDRARAIAVGVAD
jgi:hypothetical protein